MRKRGTRGLQNVLEMNFLEGWGMSEDLHLFSMIYTSIGRTRIRNGTSHEHYSLLGDYRRHLESQNSFPRGAGTGYIDNSRKSVGKGSRTFFFLVDSLSKRRTEGFFVRWFFGKGLTATCSRSRFPGAEEVSLLYIVYIVGPFLFHCLGHYFSVS